MKKKITVFTPIYNRAYCIHKLYESLKRQTFKEFEWLVIDDGSIDNIKDIILTWRKEEKEFPIRFYRTENGGKMRAVNKAVVLAEAPAFFIVDSDDYLVDNALELVWKWFTEIKDDVNFAGVSGLKDIKSINAKYDFKYIDATNLERRKYNLIIDMAECYKTEVLKRYPAPEIEGEKYISPSIVWNSIAKDDLKIRWFNIVIYKAEYLPDGLSAIGPDIRTRNPKGWGKLIQLSIECKRDVEFLEFQYYLYYKCLKDILSLNEMAENLGLTIEQYEKYVKNKPTVICKINEYLRENNIKSIGLYGLGGEAKRFLRIVDDLDLEIVYGIDRNPNKLLKQCYSLNDDIPLVDAIFITNRAGIADIKEEMNRRTNCKLISIQEDILNKSFNYYFSDI